MPGAPAGRAAAGRRGAATAVLLAASLAVAGCGASGDEAATSEAIADKGAAAPPRATGGGYERGGQRAPGDGRNGAAAEEHAPGRPKAAKVAPSQIIRTATVTVETKDLPEALAKARTAVDGAGGYTGDETTDRDAEGHDRSKLVLRVPPKEYDAVLGRLSRLGKLVSREVSAKDVTEQVVDTESRIKTQRASVTRVRELMERATTISDIVSLESELNTREADLESLEAQLASLKERTGMATITLLLRQPGAAPQHEDDPTSFGDALSGGWHAFTEAVRWLLVIIGAVLPFAAAGALLHGLWRLVRDRLPAGRRTRRRGVNGGGVSQGAGPVDPAGAVGALGVKGADGAAGAASMAGAAGMAAGSGGEDGTASGGPAAAADAPEASAGPEAATGPETSAGPGTGPGTEPGTEPGTGSGSLPGSRSARP
ncbi:DUF4349 domain-containing protein [Streptomyces piniterrae]|uniref:DUF4349 domain-containing protein n=1 Tax=Streptomyces piniterrae TaxID=2571125 RepID=UPI001FED0F04|nr:DUF4349 domain-containing protein [Streptomyces piniterrae]